MAAAAMCINHSLWRLTYMQKANTHVRQKINICARDRYISDFNSFLTWDLTWFFCDAILIFFFYIHIYLYVPATKQTTLASTKSQWRPIIICERRCVCVFYKCASAPYKIYISFIFGTNKSNVNIYVHIWCCSSSGQMAAGRVQTDISYMCAKTNNIINYVFLVSGNL